MQLEAGSEPTNRLGFDIHLPASADAAGTARAALRELSLDPEMLFSALLLTTELITNSVRHAGLRPSDSLRVVAAWPSDQTFKVSVWDRSKGHRPSKLAGAIRPAPSAESGWGLYFVDQLATRWGYDAGRGYWFELEACRA